jgi:hypothetical protein
MPRDHIDQLLSIASGALGDGVEPADRAILPGGRTFDELLALLKRRDGFYAFESALHVFPLRTTADSYGLIDWNAADLWRGEYATMADGYLFFAEDLFGEQFALKDDAVWRFNPETGTADNIADTVADWARRILDDYDAETGHPLAHQWQTQHGQLGPRQRLMPRKPFVAGGEFTTENLVLVESAASLRLRASIAQAIKDLPDGTPISIEIGEP